VELKVTVKTEANNAKEKAFVKGIIYSLDNDDANALEVTSTNFSELAWDNFYAVY